MTGSRAQLYNGILLLVTFFGCRLVWGTYQSLRVYQDVWAALHTTGADNLHPNVGKHNVTLGSVGTPGDADEMMRFAGDRQVPLWLACTYLGSNVVLNTLNFYWFGKMIETVRKRFQPQKERKGRGKANKGENGRVVVGGGEEKSGIRSEGDGAVGMGRVVVETRQVRKRKG